MHVKRYKTIFYKEWALVGMAFVVSSLFLYAEWKLPETHKAVGHAGHAWLIQSVQFYYDGISNKVAVGGNVVQKDLNLYYSREKDAEFKTVVIYDPILYPAFCALLWRLLGTPSLWSLKLLNIILFSLLMILVFRVMQMLFEDKSKAFIGALGVLGFLPLVYQNIENVRDVYQFYGLIIFLYFILTYVLEDRSKKFLMLGAISFIFCYWIRPAILSRVSL